MKKYRARFDVTARQNQLPESRADSGLTAKSPGNPGLRMRGNSWIESEVH
jgi:hypothetical protein